jgi:cyclic-di-AMP phosphodiesterase PgpH
MGILDHIRLAPASRRRSYGTDDTELQGADARRNLFIKIGIFGLLVVLTVLAFPRRDIYRFAAQTGDEWRYETLVAPFDFAILKDPEEIEEERRAVRYRTPPYFESSPAAQEGMNENRAEVEVQLDRIFEAYESFMVHRVRGRLAEAAQDSVRYMDFRRQARLKATPEQWRMLESDWNRHIRALSPAGPVATGPRLDERILHEAWEMGTQLNRLGVMDVTRDSVHTDQIMVRDEAEQVDRMRDKDAVYGLNEAYDYAQDQFELRYNDQVMAGLAGAFFRAIFQPSLIYMRAVTVREWQRLEQRISPTRGLVREGDVIVREGHRVTEEVRQQLASLERALHERGAAPMRWHVSFGQFLLTLATYLIFFLYLFLIRRRIFDDNRKVFLIALLFAGVIGMLAIALRLPQLYMYAVPVAIASILLTVIFDSRVGIFATLTFGLLGGNLLGYDFEFAFATIFAGAMGVFSVRDIKNRGQFFLSAGLVLIGYLLVLSAGWLIFDPPGERVMSHILQVTVNSFLLLMAYPLLWVFERAFDVTTDLTLLELSDTNRPLLKELSLRAPGTFNHVLQVANLAEAAADSIGANALLARVGALYHDIGKMLKPEYFIENQRPGDNPHDSLKPRMSALIIASHVKEGLEMGRQYRLPQRVLDFIPMHHGTTRIEYFYRRALEQQADSDREVHESEFRYPGPRPNSNETGILLLADSVEAASRSLPDPTHRRLETLIDMIFKARIEDGQLDETQLTFSDLAVIKETFLQMLAGMYHVRVKYPGQEGGERRAVLPPAKRLGTLKNADVLGLSDQSVVIDEPEPDTPAEGADPEEAGDTEGMGRGIRMEPAPPGNGGADGSRGDGDPAKLPPAPPEEGR